MATVRVLWLGSCLLAALAAPALAQESQRPYAGLEARAIKALSPEKIAALRAGEGAGYALAAELNGYPGPAHVLEHADALALTDEQRARTRTLHEAMTEKAILLGEELIEAEAALERAFRDGILDPARLSTLVSHAARVEAGLRTAHLVAHLEMAEILTPAQIDRYDALRGYGGGEGEGSQASGHDPAAHGHGHRHGHGHGHGPAHGGG